MVLFYGSIINHIVYNINDKVKEFEKNLHPRPDHTQRPGRQHKEKIRRFTRRAAPDTITAKGVYNMDLTFTEQIKITAARKGITLGDLATLTDQSRQNLSNKMARGNFTVEQMQKIAAALDCNLIITLQDKATKTGV